MLKIPFECYPRQIQKAFAEKGYKLEINGEDREPDSWGFIVNKGNEYEIITYKGVTQQELTDIWEIVNVKNCG